jgi:Fe2+ transport system protein B
MSLLLFFGLPILMNGIFGAQAVDSSDIIKKNISVLESTKKSIDDIVKETGKTEQNLFELDDKIQNTYLESIKTYINMKNDLENNLTKFIQDIRKIELVGILLIVIIFFLLLLKQFNLLKTLQYILNYPFIFIYEKITGNKIK